jgi:hypothetical protein
VFQRQQRKPKLREVVRGRLRARYYSWRPERRYVGRIRPFVAFHGRLVADVEGAEWLMPVTPDVNRAGAGSAESGALSRAHPPEGDRRGEIPCGTRGGRVLPLVGVARSWVRNGCVAMQVLPWRLARFSMHRGGLMLAAGERRFFCGTLFHMGL